MKKEINQTKRKHHRTIMMILVFCVVAAIVLVLGVVALVALAKRKQAEHEGVTSRATDDCETALDMYSVVFCVTVTCDPASDYEIAVRALESLAKSSVAPRAVLCTVVLEKGRNVPETIKACAEKDKRIVIHVVQTDTYDSLAALRLGLEVVPSTETEEEEASTVVILADTRVVYPERYHEQLVTQLHERGGVVAYRGRHVCRSESSTPALWQCEDTDRADTALVLDHYTGVAFFQAYISFVEEESDRAQTEKQNACAAFGDRSVDDAVLSFYFAQRKGLKLHVIGSLPHGDRRGVGPKEYPIPPLLPRAVHAETEACIQCYRALCDSGPTVTSAEKSAKLL